ncbi:hypothetical protein VNO78_33514 [Psophocarpus tetragonolobus]|uniref:Uncharacterized protein n=1 Tax=Psophocarpus tetragonolobus TaxID=3891 RepID=A0AAN9P466_PSOTE
MPDLFLRTYSFTSRKFCKASIGDVIYDDIQLYTIGIHSTAGPEYKVCSLTQGTGLEDVPTKDSPKAVKYTELIASKELGERK